MIHPQILSHDKLNQICLELAFEESKHPRNKSGKFAKKGNINLGGGKSSSGGSQFKRGKQRFEINESETESEAYQRTLQESKTRRTTQQRVRIAQHQKFNQGIRDWQNQSREQRNVDIAAQAREGEYKQESGTEHLLKETAQDVGVLVGVNKLSGLAKKVFSKKSEKNNVDQVVTAQVVGPSRQEVRQEAIKSAKTQFDAKNKLAKRATNPTAKRLYAREARQAARSAYRETTKKLLHDVGTATSTSAALSIAQKSVPVSRLASAGRTIFGVTKLGALRIPHIAVLTAVAYTGYNIYKGIKDKNRKRLLDHEREMMIREKYGLRLSFDESKHPRDEKGRWTGSKESNQELINRVAKIPSFGKHIATGATVGAAVGTLHTPVIGTAIGAAAGGALASTRKFTLKKTYEKAAHAALEKEMRKHIVEHYGEIIRKSSSKNKNVQYSDDEKGISGIIDHVNKLIRPFSKNPDKHNYPKKYRQLDVMLQTYQAFKSSPHNVKQKAIKTNSLDKLATKKLMTDIF